MPSNSQSPDIFISHCAKDAKLVSAFVNFIQLGCDISEKQIFCSSLEGIPNGEYFVKTILTKLSEAQLVLAVVSHEYAKSQFCLAEAGVAEFRHQINGSCKCFLLLVPPYTYEDISGVFHGVQAGKISDEDHLGELRQLVRETLSAEAKEKSWRIAKKSFLEVAKGVLYEKEMIRLTFDGLKIIHKEVEKLTPQQEDTLRFKRKYSLDLRNETGKAITLHTASIRCKPSEAKAHPRPWHAFQPLIDGQPKGENQHLSVEVGESFRVKVAFDNLYRYDELQARELADELGTINIEISVGGILVPYHRRLC